MINRLGEFLNGVGCLLMLKLFDFYGFIDIYYYLMGVIFF